MDIQKVYDEWLRSENDLHYRKRYEGKENWFHASASGMCMRKHYFQHVAGIKPKPVNDDTMRLFRLGDLVHEDIQEAVRDYVSEQIAGFKKPRRVVFVEELPYEKDGIDREAVKAKWGD